MGLSNGRRGGANFVQGVGARGYRNSIGGLATRNAYFYGGPGNFRYGYGGYYGNYYGGYVSPWWRGHHYGYGHHHGHHHHGFWFGFGYHYYPGYWGGYSYPYYRSYSYYPYSYYSTVGYYPAYPVVYYSDYSTVSYADTTDPYVEYIDDTPVSTGKLVPAVPSEFLTPFVKGFPAGLSPGEALSRGETWLKEGDYPTAAEAFRQAWLGRPDDYYAPFQLALALFGLGQYELAGRALDEGLDRNASWVHRRMNVAESFEGPAVFEALLKDLQRAVVRAPDGMEARFVLGYLFLFSGREFEAHGIFNDLERDKWESPHLASFVNEATSRLLDRPDTAPASRGKDG